MGNELTAHDISCEEWREYDWVGRVYRIERPVTLYLKSDGTIHRVLDEDGVVHCVPTVGERGCALRWKNKPGHAPAEF